MTLGRLMALDIEDLKEHYNVARYRKDVEELLLRQQIDRPRQIPKEDALCGRTIR